jgi:hypothetical protein
MELALDRHRFCAVFDSSAEAHRTIGVGRCETVDDVAAGTS